MTAHEVQRRWPGFVVPEGMLGVYEPRAGVLAVERCVAAHLEDARAAGAALHPNEAVLDFHADRGGITVETARGNNIPPVGWSSPQGHGRRDGWPVLASHWLCDANHCSGSRPRRRRIVPNRAARRFCMKLPGGVFYGFPELEAGEIKIAEHSGGDVVDDPLSVDRRLHPADQRRLESFITACLPDVSLRRTAHMVCMYTMSADEHFIVDRLPGDNRISFAAGLSGHGFKFAPVLGEALASLALDGETALPIAFLNSARPGLRSK